MNWLTNYLNPSTVVNPNKVLHIYMYVHSANSVRTHEKPFVINFVFGSQEDDYVSWEFEKFHQWQAALNNLGLSHLCSETAQMAKDRGHI